MYYQLKSMGVLQTAKICAILYAVMGLFHFTIGIFMVLFASGPQKGAGVMFILMPIIMAVFGFIGVAIMCLIYNFIASKVGGIEIELEPNERHT